MYDDTMKQNASIIAAYQTVRDNAAAKPVVEADTGGDTSAYNKYLLAKTGTLPRTKAEYIAAGEETK